MDNLSFWSSAVDLIDELTQESFEGDVISAEQRIASFVEVHRDRFDPAEDFKEYVMVKFARLIARLNEQVTDVQHNDQ